MEHQDSKSIASVDNNSLASLSSGNGPSQSTNLYSNTKDNVKVVIRVRPFNEKEKNHGQKKCVSVENLTSIAIEARPDYKMFNFDFVGDEQLNQDVIFSQIAKPIADCCLEGYNGSIFAYGQTGSGKTFTIQGPSISLNGEETVSVSLRKDGGAEYENRGLMPRSFEYIFDCMDQEMKNAELQGDSHFEYLVRCSYLEIYNEQIMDLLDPTSVNLNVREDIKKGVYVEGLLEEVVQNAQDMMGVISRGSKNRHVGSTSMNKESSRSHSVLTTIIETKSMKQGGSWNIKTSRFHIIDLAGSERAKHTNAVGDRLKEAGMINKSLSALGNVINSLVDISEGKSRHVHYRDSKLTFLLRDSLGGNSKTVIIANISPSSINYGETLSTLKFAQRAKQIRNKAVINEDSSGTIAILKSEISRLKKDLAESEKRSQSLGQQCAFCKNNIDNDNLLDLDAEESLLIDVIPEDTTEESRIDAGQSPSKQNTKKKVNDYKTELIKMRKRVVYLESLLSANLDNLTCQQKFYDQEVQRHQQQMKKQQQSVASFEKQCTRDKMIIKFREDRINKLEQNQPVTSDDKQKQINDLKKEIAVWKEAVDHNAQAAKLFAEKADLLNKLECQQKELKHSPDSLQAQMRSLTDLNESLGEYLKLYCEDSKKEVENELARVKMDFAEQMEGLNTQIDEIKKHNDELNTEQEANKQAWHIKETNYKLEVERLRQEFSNDKEEIERLSHQAFEQLKKEIDEISVNKSEQENQSQTLKIQLLEKEKELAKQLTFQVEKERQHASKLSDAEETLQQLQIKNAKLQSERQGLEELSIKKSQEFSAQLESERKQMAERLKEAREQAEKRLQELQKQMLDEKNEKEIVQEECYQMSSRIKNLEEENETVQQSLLFKHEEAEELQRTLGDKNLKLAELLQQGELLKASTAQSLDEKEQALQTLQNQIDSLKSEIATLQQQLIHAQQDCQQLEKALKEIEEEVNLLTIDKQELEARLDTSIKDNDTQGMHLAKLREENQQLQVQIGSLQTELQSQEKKALGEKQNAEAIKADLKASIKKLETEVNCLNSEISAKEQELEKSKQFELKQNQSSQQRVNELNLLLQTQKEESTTTISQFDQKYKAALADQAEEHKKNMAQLQTKFESSLSQREEELMQEIKQMKADKEVFLKCLNDKQEELALLTQKFTETETRFKKEQDLQAKLYSEQKEQALQEASFKAEQAQDAIRQELTREFERKLADQISQHDQVLQKQLQETKMQQREETKSELSCQMQSLTKQIETLQLEKSNLTQELTGKIETYTQQLNAKEDQLASQSLSSNHELLELQEEISSYQCLVKELQQEVKDQSLHCQTQNQLSEQVLQKDTQLLECSQQIEQLQAREAALQQELDTLRTKEGEMCAQISSLREQLEESENRVKGLQNLAAKESKQRADLQQQIQELTQTRSQSEHLSQESQRLLKQKVQEITLLNQSVERLQELNKQEALHKAEVIDELEEREKEIKTLKGQYNVLAVDKNSLTQKYQSLVYDMQQVESKLSETASLAQQYSDELGIQKQSLNETLKQKDEENSKRLLFAQQESQQQYSALQQEAEFHKKSCKEVSAQLAKMKQRNEEQNEMLKSSKETISGMVQKESQIMQELEQKVADLKEHQEKWKVRVQEAKEEKDQLRKEWERIKKENENLRELVKLKDRQIEEQLNSDQRDRQDLERQQKENKELKNQITKREFEMKEVVRTLKFYSEEKNRLEKELDKLHRENDQLIGHKNPSQKIQHHLKIKEENNKLREDNFKLQEELRRKTESMLKSMKQVSPVANQSYEDASSGLGLDLKKLKRENITYQETINRLVDHILSQPGLMKILGMNEETLESIQRQNGTGKVKNAMEIISLFSNILQSKEREIKEVVREKKKMECRLEITEKEKNLCKQQLDHLQSSTVSDGFSQNIKTPSNYSQLGSEIYLADSGRSQFEQQTKFQNSANHQNKMRIDALLHEHSGFPKQTPSPLTNFKNQKEKENLNSKRELFSSQRSGSSKRQAYLSNK